MLLLCTKNAIQLKQTTLLFVSNTIATCVEVIKKKKKNRTIFLHFLSAFILYYYHAYPHEK